MIERDHAPNAGTGLLGANFSRRNRQAPTDDRAGTGRWIAIDASGYDGDQLHGGDRYMILGSVAIDDADPPRSWTRCDVRRESRSPRPR